MYVLFIVEMKFRGFGTTFIHYHRLTYYSMRLPRCQEISYRFCQDFLIIIHKSRRERTPSSVCFTICYYVVFQSASLFYLNGHLDRLGSTILQGYLCLYGYSSLSFCSNLTILTYGCNRLLRCGVGNGLDIIFIRLAA